MKAASTDQAPGTDRPSPDDPPGRVVARWPIPIVLHRSAVILLIVIEVMTGSFTLLYAVQSGHRVPTGGDLLTDLAVAMIWPVAAVLHECGHAVTGALVGRPPLWARIGVLPGVALTPPPTERWARLLVSGSGPVLEILVGVVCLVIGPGTGADRFLTEPVSMAGAVCLVNGAANLLLPWPRNSDGAKLWRAAREMVRRRTPRRKTPGKAAGRPDLTTRSPAEP